jgi:hypothetical protein
MSTEVEIMSTVIMSGSKSVPATHLSGLNGGGSLPQGPDQTIVATSTDVQNHADAVWFVVAVVLIGAGIVGGVSLNGREGSPVFTPSPSIDGFALFYILAQALERLSEVVSYTPWVGARIGKRIGAGSGVTKEGAQHAFSTAIRTGTAARSGGGDPTSEAQKAADAKQDLEVIRSNRAAFFLGFNAAVAAAGVGYFDLPLLKTVGVSGVSIWLDIAMTGLAIGGGTKPLHDLIKNIQKAKEQREDAAAVTTVTA